MKRVTAELKYVRLLSSGRLNAVWNALPKRGRRYAHELVERFGYTTHMALEVAFAWMPATSERDAHEFICNHRDPDAHARYGYHVNGRTGHIGAAVTKRENEIYRLVKFHDYTPEEAAASCDRRGVL